MPSKVVHKIILGFSAFGALLILTSALSFLGLNDIKSSAADVVENKMPVQTQMMGVKTSILSLSTMTANGYYKSTLAELATNQSEFEMLSNSFQSQIENLTRQLSGNSSAVDALNLSKTYVDQSNAMYLSLQSRLETEQTIKIAEDEALLFADEASALMLDLGYLESNDPQLATMIGAGNNLDNKLLTLSNTIKELVESNDSEASLGIYDDLDYQLSNIIVDKDYINRLSQDVDDGGIVESFNEQHRLLIDKLMGENGLVSLHKEKLSLISATDSHRDAANAALKNALSTINTLFESVTKSTLQGQNAILDTVEQNQYKNGIVLVIGIVAAFILATWVTKSIAVPLARINRGLNKLSQGDLTQKLNDTGSDEFSALAGKVNSLTASLRDLVGNILEQERHLETATKNSIAMGDKSLQLVDEQREQIGVTSQHTQFIQQASQNNLEQIKQAMSSLNQVADQSQKITKLVSANRKQVQGQAEQADASAKVIHRLDENSRNIGSILDVIKTIAEQTNLLALNAAIEAARAGEQGRGFAVVADEVRTLANRTHNSTEEIEAMIGNLQKDAEQAVSAITQGREQAKVGVSLTEQVSEQVNSISAIIGELTDINSQIVAETQNQDELLGDVATNLNRIVELAQASAKSTQESNDATADVDQGMEQLHDAVKRFTL